MYWWIGENQFIALKHLVSARLIESNNEYIIMMYMASGIELSAVYKDKKIAQESLDMLFTRGSHEKG